MKSSAWWPSAIFVAPTSCHADTARRAQPRAERARRLVGIENILDELADSVCSTRTPSRAPRRSSRSGRACILVTRIHVHGNERKPDRRALGAGRRGSATAPSYPSRPTIRPSRDRHLRSAVVDDRLRGLLSQPGLSSVLCKILRICLSQSMVSSFRLAIFEGIDFVYDHVQGPDRPLVDAGGESGARDLPTSAELMTATDGEGTNRSYLATEESFKFLKDLETRNLIVAGCR